MTKVSATSSVRLIKRYGNRKLYDVRSSRYVTLEGVRDLVQGGEDIRVVDNESGEDLTAVTFAQIIYEEAKRTNGSKSLPLLRWLVERGDEAVRDFLKPFERGREAFESVREAAEKRVQKLVRAGDKQRHRLEELMELPQRRLDELQHSIDAQVRQSVERVTRHPVLRKEIRRVEQSIRELEKRLGRLTRRPAAARPKRRTKKSRA